ncbi:MAG: Metallo-dependent phosphatase-like protein [Lentinula lateritia]|uniref:Metallo-dependent phosphatase-like protein n=1 Tax=Lentinula lateritia TaxID=40482 RepID=A0ABQ8W187_9AGAR|nr:MAG: Metallo-dependent phosphatase-like protein [Lentinula lateritia]KAJ4501792.1 Metallo-dependent phosphatase-like protein [Lentinula lateritia]
MSKTLLNIIHFNDVYRVSPQRLSSRSPDTIDVTQFAVGLDNVRDGWPLRGDGKRDGLVLFSGDVFSPSVESSVTRGSHMVPVMNFLKPDVSMTGNHDFDFGYLHLTELIKDCNFPWLLSNIIDTVTMKIPFALKEFEVLERSGIRVGVIGLVEKEWITTVPTWPQNFVYKDVKEVGIDLSTRLRDPNGPYKCEIIIALTHCRVPNDIKIAKDLFALSPSAQQEKPIAGLHGVDIVLGGHDHMYYISKGVSSWEGYDVQQPSLGAEQDHGDVLVVKSGTDFRDLSDFTLTLESTPAGSVRKKVISSITGRRVVTQPGSRSSEELTQMLRSLLSAVSKSLEAPVCKSIVTLDLRSNIIRTEESAAGNWFADIIRHAYDDCETLKGCGGSDAVLICAGTLRGDSEYGPGNISLGDILEILPFDDPLVVLELDGDAIWDALESGLSTWPAQEGRFPVVSGMRVAWDSQREPGNRILSIWLTKEMEDSIYNGGGGSGYSTPRVVDAEPIPRVKGGRQYRIVSREYMAQGHDGFTALRGRKYLVDDESGQPMSSIVRKYLLGSQYVNSLARMVEHPSTENLCEGTKDAVHREKAHRQHPHRQPNSKATLQWKHAADLAVRWVRSRAHYQDHLNVATTEHMSSVDVHDGKQMRTSSVHENQQKQNIDEDLLVVDPRVDGRFEDVGRK